MGQPSPPLIAQYDRGDLVRVVASFVGTDGVTPANPSMIHLLVKSPDGSVATYRFGAPGASIIQVGSAAYARDLDVSQVGSWYYRWEGTGGVQAADEWALVVTRSQFYL
jgi:hypothetical protein